MILLTANQILSRTWRQLFSAGDSALIQREWRDYARIWHPDVSKDPRAAEVMSHVTAARDRALNGPRLEFAEFRTKEGKLFTFSYFSRRPWEAGEIFVTESTVVYRVSKDFADLAYEDEKRQWHFQDDRLRDEMTRFLPNRVRIVELSTEGRLMIYRRTKDQVLLGDLLDRLPAGPVPDVHAMWMVSAMLNICTYLYLQDQTHFGFTPDVLLVSPEHHSVALTGPCLYLTEIPRRPQAVPSAVLSRWPQLRDKKAKVPYFVADTTEIRSIAMRALGVHDLATLRARDDVNSGLRTFIQSQPNKSTLEDYKNWADLRGKRKFTPYDLNPQQVYDLG